MIMAGGTGGHVFPALAVAQRLSERGTNVRWMGTRRGLESRVVPAAGFAIDWIAIEGLRGKSRLSVLLAPIKLLRAVVQSVLILRTHKPKAVLGMGGFVAGPGGLGAWLLGIPLIVHEQNAVAGLTNRYLAKLATRVLSGFPQPLDLPADTQWVGNPVRAEFSKPATRSKSAITGSPLRVLVIGGSQGALSFNRNLPALFAECWSELVGQNGFEVWHQTGRDRAQEVQALYALRPELNVRVSEFIDDMAEALAWADLLVCRAGAMTIAEICAVGRASVLVPYPHSAGDHQEINAKYLVDAGAAVMVEDSCLATFGSHKAEGSLPAEGSQSAEGSLPADGSSSAEGSSLAEGSTGAVRLREVVVALLRDDTKRAAMATAARNLHRADALNTVSDICQEYVDA